MDIISKMVSDRPKFHRKGETTWAVDETVLREIKRHIGADSRTLETGCGLSTALFCISGCQHVCVTPSEDEADRVRKYCHQLGYTTENVHFDIGSSDGVLPKQSKGPPLDFVLIDGAHGFPFPELDFHYTESRLQVGGVVVVDDVQIPSVNYLYRFLQIAKEWELICLVQNTAFFRKHGERTPNGTWSDQEINRTLIKPPFTFRVVRKLKILIGRKV